MNFSQYIDSKSDFWLQKWCQSVSCDHPILGLHHVFSPFATSYPTQRAASLPAFLALRWSKGSRPLLSMAPPSPSAYSCASCTTFGQQKVSFPLRQQSTGNLCTSSGGLKINMLRIRPVSLLALFTRVAISEFGQRYWSLCSKKSFGIWSTLHGPGDAQTCWFLFEYVFRILKAFWVSRIQTQAAHYLSMTEKGRNEDKKKKINLLGGWNLLKRVVNWDSHRAPGWKKSETRSQVEVFS